MLTGTPIPFRNYQLVRYFTVGSETTETSETTTLDVKEDEVGFKGSLGVFKQKNSYYVEGFIDLSAVSSFVETTVEGGVFKAPLIDGKSFKINTELNDIDSIIVVGGFKVKGLDDKDLGVPFLQRIPLFGYLFKEKQNYKQNSEFIVVIKLKSAHKERKKAQLKEIYKKIKLLKNKKR